MQFINLLKVMQRDPRDFYPVSASMDELAVGVLPPRESMFTGPWWPRSGFSGDTTGDCGLADSLSQSWARPDVDRLGASSRYSIGGVSRDVNGSAVGGVTVKLFSTASDVIVDTIVSDASGAFRLLTHLYPDTHYVTAYKAGAPDISGCSVNTLIGM